jgi:hypothetical protein
MITATMVIIDINPTKQAIRTTTTKCEFTVTRPTLIFASDPMHFYTEFG